MKLFDEFAVGLRSVLPFSMILRAFLDAFAVLHQLWFLPVTVRADKQGKPRAISKSRQRYSLLPLILSFLVLV